MAGFQGRLDSYSGDGSPSDPYTEARFAKADEDRMSLLNQLCKREMDLAREARETAQRAGRAGGATHVQRPLTRTHAQRPGTPRTYCGRTVSDTRKAGTVLPSDLHPDPSCRACQERMAPRVAPAPAAS